MFDYKYILIPCHALLTSYWAYSRESAKERAHVKDHFNGECIRFSNMKIALQCVVCCVFSLSFIVRRLLLAQCPVSEWVSAREKNDSLFSLLISRFSFFLFSHFYFNSRFGRFPSVLLQTFYCLAGVVVVVGWLFFVCETSRQLRLSETIKHLDFNWPL